MLYIGVDRLLYRFCIVCIWDMYDNQHCFYQKPRCNKSHIPPCWSLRTNLTFFLFLIFVWPLLDFCGFWCGGAKRHIFHLGRFSPVFLSQLCPFGDFASPTKTCVSSSQKCSRRRLPLYRRTIAPDWFGGKQGVQNLFQFNNGFGGFTL